MPTVLCCYGVGCTARQRLVVDAREERIEGVRHCQIVIRDMSVYCKAQTGVLVTVTGQTSPVNLYADVDGCHREIVKDEDCDAHQQRSRSS